MATRTFAVVGAGSVGRGLVQRLTEAGHNPDRARSLVAGAAVGPVGAAWPAEIGYPCDDVQARTARSMGAFGQWSRSMARRRIDLPGDERFDSVT